MSGETQAPAAAETVTPAPNGADTGAPQDKAAPADSADDFLADTTPSEAKPAEGKADDKAAPSKEDDGFLAETDDDDAESKADAPGDAEQEDAAEAYQQFTLPEGLELDTEVMAKATPIFRKLGLNQDGAQELVSLYAQVTQAKVEGFHEALVESHNQRLKEWTKASKEHAEFGGANLAQSKALAAKAFALEPEARKVLVEYGLDRNPHIFALLARVGSKLSPDTLVRDDAGAPEKAAPQRVADLMYSS